MRHCGTGRLVYAQLDCVCLKNNESAERCCVFNVYTTSLKRVIQPDGSRVMAKKNAEVKLSFDNRKIAYEKTALFYLITFLSPATQASALYFYEIGTEDAALAGAGQAARAQDASTIVTNPAGMTRLPDHMFTGGLQAMDGDISYDLDNASGRKSPGNVMNLFPNASAFYSQKVNDRLYAGVGLYGNYGLGIDFGNWAGDRLIKKSTMVAMTLSPSLAYKLSDRVSVGDPLT